MSDDKFAVLRFDDFELDERNARLTRQGQQLQLPPKAFAVLCALARQPGRLLTKDALLDSAWGHRHVSESVLKTTISQVRAALADVATEPRYIETVPRRGYRFSARIADSAPPFQPLAAGNQITMSAPLPLVGRRAELQRLQLLWRKAAQGQRQIVWVTGDAGVGKSTLISAFAADVNTASGVAMVRGQCVEQGAAGEPYLPILEALGSLARSHSELPAMLRAVAPTWLLQMPWLIGDVDRSALQRELAGVHPDRMVRELPELIERLTRQRPLLLITEDLHWSDTATLRLIDHFARGHTPLRFMWIGSVRLTQVIAAGHPLQQLRQELRLHRRCEEIGLTPFSEAEVGDYMASRCPGAVSSEPFLRRLHQHTDGLPLFVASVVETLLSSAGPSLLQQAECSDPAADGSWTVPDNLADAIEAHISHLAVEQQALLEIASVAGMEFRAALVAEVIGRDTAWAAEHCDELVRRQYWLRQGTVAVLADGTLDVSYAFRHAMYRHVFYRRIAAGPRVQFHRRIAACLERSRGAGLTVTPAVLARQYELGLLLPAAVRHYAAAAQGALTHFAPGEAAAIAAHALELLQQCPAAAASETLQRYDLELALVTHRGVACSQVHGIGAATTRAAFERAQVLCDLLPSTSERALMLNGLGWVAYVRGDYAHALSIAERLHVLAGQHADRLLQVCASNLFGVALQMRAEHHAARRWLEAGIAMCDELGEQIPEALFVVHPAVLLRVNLCVPLLHLGYVEQARRSIDTAYQRAQDIGQPMGRMVTQWNLALLEMRLQRPAQVAALGDALNEIVTRTSLAQGEGPRRWVRGWAQAHLGQPREGHQLIMEGYRCHQQSGMRAAGAEVLGYATEALLFAHDWEAAAAQAAEALSLAQSMGEKLLLPYLLMLQAHSARGLGKQDAALSLLEQALAEAQSQRSLWFQLRVATLLCESPAPRSQDVQALREICATFPEAWDCIPYIRAREVLAAVAP